MSRANSAYNTTNITITDTILLTVQPSAQGGLNAHQVHRHVLDRHIRQRIRVWPRPAPRTMRPLVWAIRTTLTSPPRHVRRSLTRMALAKGKGGLPMNKRKKGPADRKGRAPVRHAGRDMAGRKGKSAKGGKGD